MSFNYLPPPACPVAVEALRLQREWFNLANMQGQAADLSSAYFSGGVAIDGAIQACPFQGCEMGTYNRSIYPPASCPIDREIDATIAMQTRAIERIRRENAARRESNKTPTCSLGSTALQAHKIRQSALRDGANLEPRQRKKLMREATALMPVPGIIARCALCYLGPNSSSPRIPEEKRGQNCPNTERLQDILEKARRQPPPRQPGGRGA